MPEEGIQLRDRTEFMTHEELIDIAKTFVNLGVKKIRLTGGEPLIKKNFAKILGDISELPVELAITTNGILLDKYWNELVNANLTALNISLDSLQEERFNTISRRQYYKRIQNNIEGAIHKGFNIKINVVLMKGVNDDEIIDFIEFTKENKVSIRFIEFMPFDGNKWDWSKKVSEEEIINLVNSTYNKASIEKLILPPNSTSRNYKITGYKGEFGMISSVTNPFCDSCNRIRLTADGKLKNCLFSNNEIDLLTAHRKGEDIKELIISSIGNKKKERAGISSFSDENFNSENRSMTTIGG